MILHSAIGNTELLSLYGDERYEAGVSVRARWYELTHPWEVDNSSELGDLRQLMLQVHKEIDPSDSRWKGGK